MYRTMCTPRFTKNFNCAEMACKCCGSCLMSHVLMHALQELRDNVGRSIYILSGFRCSKHNLDVGGAEFSKHMLGEAADIVITGMTVHEMQKQARKVKVFYDGGIGVYPRQGFIHVDVRQGSARWIGS